MSQPTNDILWLKKSLFGTDPCKKNNIMIILNENENNDAISSSAMNHITIALSVKIITIGYFYQIVQP